MNAKILVPAAVAAAAIGGAGGAAVVVLTDGPAPTTTVVQQAPLGAGSPARTGDTRTTALTAREIYERDAPGVVFVRADVVQRSQSPFDLFPTERRGQSTGSGFVIDDRGDILTNAHVIDGAVRVTVQFADDRSAVARVVGRDGSSDLALLKVDPDGLDLRPLELGTAQGLRVGDPTVAIGNPFGLDRTLTTGVVSALQRRITAPNGFTITDVIQTDAALNPGNSGGPLLDAAGRVIGINSQIASGGTTEGNVGIGFAVPIDTAKRILPDLKRDGRVERAYLGLTSISIDRTLARLGLPAKEGVLVQSVQSGGAADRAGLRGGDVSAQLGGVDIALGGDVIVAIGGRKVVNTDDLGAVVGARRPGDVVAVDFVRDGRRRTVKVRLGKQPPSASAEG